jgi:GNAT superfamily N-acetyltransferase
MIQFRSFRNDDPPALAEIWSNQPPLRALLQPLSAYELDRLVMGKPYFDRLGLIVAVDDGKPVGFVHAGFGPSDDGTCIDAAIGVTCILMVVSHPQRKAIAGELLLQSEQYLTSRGAATLYGGGVQSTAPFYQGLYGGSALPGVLDGDELFLSACQESGYQVVGHRRILQLDLARFRPPVDRIQMQIRRSYRVETLMDPRSESWWEACNDGQHERMRFVAVPRGKGQSGGSMTFWDMEPMASCWGTHATGLIQVQIDAEQHREAMASFLLSESLKSLAADGATLAEVQIGDDQEELATLFTKAGFQQTDRGTVLRKQV